MYVSKCVKGSVKFAAKSREKSEKGMLKERKMLRNEGHDLEIKSCCSARLARLWDWNRSHFDPILRNVTEILGYVRGEGQRASASGKRGAILGKCENRETRKIFGGWCN